MPPKRQPGGSRGWKCCTPVDPPEAVPPAAVDEEDEAVDAAQQQPPQQPRTPGGHTALKRSTAVDVGTAGPAALVGHMATTCGGGICGNFGVDWGR
jgi:hypothetical protein